MFNFEYKSISSKGKEIFIEDESIYNLHFQVKGFLNALEDEVHKRLLEVPDFNYVQSKAKVFSLVNKLNEELEEGAKVIMISRHSSYIGSILIDEIITPSANGDLVHLLYFTGEISIPWLNSRANYSQVVSQLERLLKVAELKKDLTFKVIQVFDSEKMEFEQLNKGAKKDFLWKMNSKI